MGIILEFSQFNPDEKFDLMCIGYKSAFTGDKMWYYKLNRDGKEYLLVDAGMIRLLHMLWTDDNEFENSDLWDDFERPCPPIEKQIEDAVANTPKVEVELEEDMEKTFFKQHEVKVPEPVVIPDRVGGRYTYHEVNDILNLLYWDFDFREDSGYHKITQEVADVANKKGYDKLFDELIGYKFKVKSDGDHRNDGQMVDYFFTFKSPKGIKTKFDTEMCLMVGWNYHQDLIIK
jgi:hypothetical protein